MDNDFDPIFGNIQYVTHICLSGVKSLTSWSRFYQGGQGGLQGEKYDGLKLLHLDFGEILESSVIFLTRTWT